MRRRRPASAAKATNKALVAAPLATYLEQSQRPLPSLFFLLPLMVAYELGTHWHATALQDIIAFSLLRSFFNWFGATGRYLPGCALVAILLSWHIASRDSWRFPLSVLGWMALESVVLGAPLLLVGKVIAQHLPLDAGGDIRGGAIILPLGAGIYEEMVFRLMGFTLLSLLLSDLLKLRKQAVILLAVSISAILFSLYHYLGDESFTWRTFAFRALAGAYFGTIFILRGFGVTAGSHASYDIICAFLT